MSKYIHSILSILFVTLFYACSEEFTDTPMEYESIHFKVGFSDQSGSRANDAAGTPIIDGYDIRYKVEIWLKNEMTKWGETMIQTTGTHPIGANLFDFTVPKGVDIYIVAWVDYVSSGSTDDLFFNTSNIQSIEINNSTGILEDLPQHHAFTGKLLTKAGNGTPISGITVKRPLAKFCIKANDAEEWEDEFIFKINCYINVHTQFFQNFTTYNAIEGKPENKVEAYGKDMTKSNLPFGDGNDNWFFTYDDNYEYFKALLWGFGDGVGYVFIDLQMKVYDKYAPGADIPPISSGYILVTNVPLRANMVTSVSGNFILTSGQFTVTVSPDFDNPANNKTY